MEWEGMDRRNFVRANFPCKIIIYAPQEHCISTHTENIGAGGVRVIIEEKLEVFSTVDLEIYLPEEPIICQGKVVWVVERKSAYKKGFFFFDTGIEFREIKEEDKQVINNFVQKIVIGEE